MNAVATPKRVQGARRAPKPIALPKAPPTPFAIVVATVLSTVEQIEELHSERRGADISMHGHTLIEMAVAALHKLPSDAAELSDSTRLYEIVALINGALLIDEKDAPQCEDRHVLTAQALDLMVSTAESMDHFAEPFEDLAQGIKHGARSAPAGPALLTGSEDCEGASDSNAPAQPSDTDVDARRSLAFDCNYEISKLAGTVKKLTSGTDESAAYHGIMSRIEAMSDCVFHLLRLHGESDAEAGGPSFASIERIYNGSLS